MKLQVLIPQYKETEEVIKPLLDSLAIQQNIDFKEFGVVICNDGTEVALSNQFLNSYPYEIQYYKEPHRGVSGTRNACFEHATADYIMWCDADDMFMNVCGLYIIFREIDTNPFDSMVSCFVEETRFDDKPLYINHDIDGTFVHGKVHNRQFLIDNNIKWNQNLTIHEDSPINMLIQKVGKNISYCPTPFYLWRWRDDSVCRHDPKYILKTYVNMLDGNTYLIEELLKRELEKDAIQFVVSMVYDAYYIFNCKEWIDTNNKEYRDMTEKRFSEYYRRFKYLYDKSDEMERLSINAGVRNRYFTQGLMFEEITFGDWIKHIESL